MSDQQQHDEYVVRKQEKTAVEHCEQVPDGKPHIHKLSKRELNSHFYRRNPKTEEAARALLVLYLLFMSSHVGKIWLLYTATTISRIFDYCGCTGSTI